MLESKNMKIALVVPEYPPYSVGGGGEIFKSLAEEYRNMGHDVIVFYGYYPTKKFNQDIEIYNDNGVTLVKIPEIPYPKHMPFLRTVMPCNKFVLAKLKSMLTECGVNVAHIHGYGLFMPAQVAKICYKVGIPYLLTLHGAPVSPGKMKSLLITVSYKFYKKFYGDFLLNKARVITAVSKFTTTFEEFCNFKESIVVINNGLDIEKYLTVKRETSLSKRRDGEEIVFLSLGRIEWLKGFQYFINIIPDLTSSGLKVKYLIAGRDNGYKSVLDKKLKELNLNSEVSFLGFLDFEEKVRAILNCDYVLITSLVENYPAVPIEAIVLGKIPIGNCVGGIPEIIKDGKNGFLVDVVNRKNFLEKMFFIMRDKIEQTGDTKKYSWPSISKEYLSILENM